MKKCYHIWVMDTWMLRYFLWFSLFYLNCIIVKSDSLWIWKALSSISHDKFCRSDGILCRWSAFPLLIPVVQLLHNDLSACRPRVPHHAGLSWTFQPEDSSPSAPSTSSLLVLCQFYSCISVLFLDPVSQMVDFPFLSHMSHRFPPLFCGRFLLPSYNPSLNFWQLYF